MLSRRSFLASAIRSSTLLALAPAAPGFLARTARAASPDRDGRVLIVIELDGGNDGFNTVVPFADEGYAKFRRMLRLPAADLIRINDKVGLHPLMGAAGKLLDSRRLAIVQGVGYPNPNRSHFESMAIWQSARFQPKERQGLGWLGRSLDEAAAPTKGLPAALFAGGGQPPLALQARRAVSSGLSDPREFVLQLAESKRAFTDDPPAGDLAAFVRRTALDGYALADRMADVLRAPESTGDVYPLTPLADRLRLVARMIKGDIGTRIYYTRQSGYDTHAGQLGPHAGLLRELSEALRAFLDDLAAAKMADRVLVLAFSEFGRTLAENASGGTDHGTTGPVFLAGPSVRAGLFGETPKVLEPEDLELKKGIDFRRVYTTVLEDWLALPAKDAVGGEYAKLPLFKG
jgi:uncharacterized protein (DUF1501 family)